MAFMDSIDVSKPDGATEKVANLDNRQRDHRAANKNTWGVEHYTTGEHKIPRGNTAGRPASPKDKQLYINTQIGQIEQYNLGTTSWDKVASTNPEPFAAGTRMIFDQDAAPTGWTKETDVNDRVIRLVSGARVDGGSWAVSGLTPTIDAHTLVLAEIPSHTHPIPAQTWGAEGATAGFWYNGSGLATDAAGGGGGHSHTGSIASDSAWRPLHRDCIICSKD